MHGQREVRNETRSREKGRAPRRATLLALALANLAAFSNVYNRPLAAARSTTSARCARERDIWEMIGKRRPTRHKASNPGKTGLPTPLDAPTANVKLLAVQQPPTFWLPVGFGRNC